MLVLLWALLLLPAARGGACEKRILAYLPLLDDVPEVHRAGFVEKHCMEQRWFQRLYETSKRDFEQWRVLEQEEMGLDEHHAALGRSMQVLGQMMHRKVFTPVRKEVEGRDDIKKRLNDRKKVRSDYEAYRRKQLQQASSDPGNAAVYEANLENARQTF